MTAQFEVGQTVLLIADRQEPREVTVTRVGRKNVYVTVYGREYGFNMETGVEVGTYYGSPDSVRTFEQHAAAARRIELREALDRHGFRPVGYSDYSWSNAVLEDLVALLDAAKDLGR